MNIRIMDLEIKKDERGELYEIIRGSSTGSKMQGQILLTTAKPKMTKGKHFHKYKTEYYCVVRGEGLLYIRDMKTQEERKLKLSGTNPQLVTISPNYFHSITNIGKNELMLLIYIDGEYNPEDPDTYYEK